MRGYAEALWGRWEPSGTPDSLDVGGYFVIERDGVAVGCIAECWEPDHLWIDALYIDAPFQCRGIGALVLRWKVTEAASKGLATKLSVLTTNAKAEAFYRREGFRIEAESAERRRMTTGCPTRLPPVSSG